MVSLGYIATQVHDAHEADTLSEISETPAVHCAGMLPVKLREGDGSAANRSGRRPV
jgi:hypothetical protein